MAQQAGKLAEAVSVKVKRFIIRKDMAFPSKPWTCDVEWTDGVFWKAWCHSFRTRTALWQHIHAVCAEPNIEG